MQNKASRSAFYLFLNAVFLSLSFCINFPTVDENSFCPGSCNDPIEHRCTEYDSPGYIASTVQSLCASNGEIYSPDMCDASDCIGQCDVDSGFATLICTVIL